MEFPHGNKRKIVGKPTVHQNSAVSKALLEKFKISDHKYWFWILQIIAFFVHIGYFVKPLATVKQLWAPKTLEI